MSVHGEYSRALETLIACVRALNRPDRDEWIERLERARVERNPDLTAASKLAIEMRGPLEDLTEGAPPAVDACERLLSHCRLILGIQE
jgi:hypothetical protein